MLTAIVRFFEALSRILHGPDNDPVVLGLIVAVLALLFANISGFLRSRALLREKDRRIEDLVQQRNRYQEIVLQGLGVQRRTTKR